ncbi:E3 ubiquitin-protein ligase [Colletotrichum tofieldiae]|nr:E3 ubiquitin-protein ligase [Colletotrichum tofieldiae]
MPGSPSFPDPFAVITVNGDQTKTTTAQKRTLNPYWNESFDLHVNEDTILAVQVFDQKKFKKKDQGFLGVINVRIGDVIELAPDADGNSHPCNSNRYIFLLTDLFVLHRSDAHARP